MLVVDHCHECGGTELAKAPTTSIRGKLCQDCNLALTRHAIKNWDALTAYIMRHECVHIPQLFTIEESSSRVSIAESRHTRRLYIGNGAGDDRYIHVAINPSAWTVEQYAVAIGRAAGTARDQIWGRRGRHGYKVDRTYFIDIEVAINLIQQRLTGDTQ